MARNDGVNDLFPPLQSQPFGRLLYMTRARRKFRSAHREN